MTHTPISDTTILHFVCFFMLNVPVNLTFFIRSQLILQSNYLMLYFIEYMLFGTDLHMPVTMATNLRHLAR